MKKTTKGLISTPYVQDTITVEDSVQTVIVIASDGVCLSTFVLSGSMITNDCHHSALGCGAR